MILQMYKNLEDYLVEFLAEGPNIDVIEIRKKLSQTGKKYTIQAIYKSLKKLQDGGVVVKIGKNYSLRIPWILDLVHLSSHMYENYFKIPSVSDILPAIGKKEVWHFTNLLRLNDFWSQILLILIHQSKNKILLGYNPHLWFHLVQTEQEYQYLKSINIAKGKLYLIVGSRTYLDKWAEKYLEKQVVEYSYAKSYFEDNKFGYFNIIDDYLITIKIDPKTEESIDKLYKKTSSIEEINISKVLKIFDSNVRASICLEKNPEKTRKIKKKFTDYFGKNF